MFLKKIFGVIDLRKAAAFAAVLILSTAAAIPVVESEKADANAEKTVYFTFDDGPSKVTEEILEVLSKEGIKATFFVIGPSGEKTDERIERIFEEGHSIGLHTMSHDYEKIYSSTENFMGDLLYEMDWIYSVTGKECEIFRFPGGSNNSAVEEWLVEEVKERTKNLGLRFYDWNADGRDSLGEILSAEEIAENVLSSEAVGKGDVIVLMHDSAARVTSPKALEILIEEFRRLGYGFGKLE